MSKYGYREVRFLSAARLRSVCIEKNWYTFGTNEEYTHLLFDLANGRNLTTDDIVEIAMDIMEHSDTDMDIESVMYVIMKNVNVYVERESE